MALTMKLSQFLHDHGVTTREFAAQLGASPESVRLYVTGKRRPRVDVLAKIRQLTNDAVRASDFFEAEEDEESEIAPLRPRTAEGLA